VNIRQSGEASSFQLKTNLLCRPGCSCLPRCSTHLQSTCLITMAFSINELLCPCLWIACIFEYCGSSRLQRTGPESAGPEQSQLEYNQQPEHCSCCSLLVSCTVRLAQKILTGTDSKQTEAGEKYVYQC
jgi:hypothetical protein